MKYSESRGGEAPALLLRAAKTLEPLDPSLARETYLDAWSAALFAGRLATTCGLHDVSREALAARILAVPPRPSDLLLEGFARAFTEALETLAIAAESRGQQAEAAAWWTRLAEHEPLSSRVIIRLMSALAAHGDRAAALAQESALRAGFQEMASAALRRRPGD